MICGATFQAPPSSKKVTCSPECRSKRAAISASKPGRKWSAESKARRAADTRIIEQLSSIQEIATAAALERPDGRRGPEHRASKIWTLIDPSGSKIVVTNLLDWSRKNYELFEPQCDDVDAAAARVSKGFQAIASSMRGVKSRKRPVYHYKGWSIEVIPTCNQNTKSDQAPNIDQTQNAGQKKKASTIGKRIADITGQRFGRLIALHPTENRSGGSVVWHCQCDCGKTVDVPSNRLIRGNTKSCGCLRKDVAGGIFVDITGQRFGRLIALHPTENRSSSSIVWRCQCDCGNMVDVSSGNLRSGRTKSCGCLLRDGHPNMGATPGVHYVKSQDLYIAYIYHKGRQYYLGSSHDLNEALAIRAESKQADYNNFDAWIADYRRNRKRKRRKQNDR